jgi:hypothetical protein
LIIRTGIDAFEIEEQNGYRYLKTEIFPKMKFAIEESMQNSLDLCSPFWDKLWKDDVDRHINDHSNLLMLTKIIENDLTDHCQKYRLNSYSLFQANVNLEDYIKTKIIHPLAKELDNSILVKLVKWRKKLESVNIHQISELDFKSIQKIKKQLDSKYYSICITAAGMESRILPELTLISKRLNNKGLGTKFENRTLEMLVFKYFYVLNYVQKFTKLRTQISMRFNSYEKERTKQLYHDN